MTSLRSVVGWTDGHPAALRQRSDADKEGHRFLGRLPKSDRTYKSASAYLLPVAGSLDPAEKLAEVCRDVASRQPEGEERPEEPATTLQVADRGDLDAASASRCLSRANLPRAAALEEIRVDYGTSDNVGARPVVPKALPDVPDRPRIPLGHVGPCVALVVDRQVLGVHVAPKFCTARREVTCRLQDAVGRGGALFDHVNPRHAEIVIRHSLRRRRRRRSRKTDRRRYEDFGHRRAGPGSTASRLFVERAASPQSVPAMRTEWPLTLSRRLPCDTRFDAPVRFGRVATALQCEARRFGNGREALS